MLAGFSLAEADVLRKAVGKKDAELIKQELGQVHASGPSRRATTSALIDDLAAQIETFGRYGFNKSHSVAYSVLSYQTAWLKTHYPAEFMAALLSSEIGNTDKVVQYINEARELGLEVLPPDVNESGLQVHRRRRPADPLRARRGAERGLGRDRVDHRRAAATGRSPTLVRLRRADRPPALQQARARVADRRRRLRLARRTPHAARRGAGVGARRRRSCCSRSGRPARRRSSARRSRTATRTGSRVALPDVPPWTEAERLAKEKEVLGFFISGHPLERFRDEVELFGTRTTATLGEWSEHQASIGAVVTGGEAADLQEDRARSTPGWCWRISTAPPRRSSFPTPGPSSIRPSSPTRRCCSPAATATATGARTTRRSSSSRPGALDELKTSGRGRARASGGGRPRRPRPRRSRQRRGALLGSPGPDAALY